MTLQHMAPQAGGGLLFNISAVLPHQHLNTMFNHIQISGALVLHEQSHYLH